MSKHIRRPLVFLLCLCGFVVFGQQSWQGNAALARSGEFATPGLFAASNAFAENTTIVVQNAQSGQSVQVSVVQRIQGAGNIFLLLSEEAGKQIGLTGSQVIRVQAKVAGKMGRDVDESLRDEAYSSDPDVIPALSITEEQLLPAPEATSQEQPVEIAQAAEPEEQPAEAIEAPAPAEAEEPAAISEPPGTAPATVAPAPPTAEEKRLQELADRVPQKQLYMPPRQQEIYALAPEPSPAPEQPPAEEVIEEPPVEVAEVVEEEGIEEPEEVVAEVEAVVEEEGPPRVSMPGPQAQEEPLDVALPGPEAAEPDKPSPEGTRLPVPEEESPLTMAPEEPPTGEIEEEPAVEVEQVAEVAMAEAAAEAPMELSETLPSRTYFVQLGAYSTRNLAEKLAGDLQRTYSVTILPASSGGRNFYKVLVGPLNVDESGTLLYQFRSRGFKDAFIQYVE
ncbi:MAG: SPOR domain-containing protein [Spirochaetaceae bacterium]|nr:MAG: SPOR domain-containing protein [Spirochaetaceae bacterium]